MVFTKNGRIGWNRKQYTEEQLLEVDTQWRGFLRKWKIKRNYPAELIINMDEVPLYMDMCRGGLLIL